MNVGCGPLPPAMCLAQSSLVALSLALLLFPQPAISSSPGFESPPEARVADVLGPAASGPNYQVLDPVTGDGLLRIYRIKSTYGTFTVAGDAMLLQRRRELAAMSVLEHQSRTGAFAGSVARSAVAPVEFAAGLLTDPAGTVGRTASGVAEMFDRVGSDLSNMGSSRDSAVGSFLGVSAERRKLAARLGVDPYTDFTPLAKRLDQFAGLAAAGGLLVGVGTSFIPGAPGLAVSTTSTASGLGGLVRDKTPAQLVGLNRARLAKLGVASGLIRRFLGNRTYTPADQTAIVSALAALKGAKDISVYIEWAAAVKRRDLAVHVRARSELLVEYQARTRAVRRFVSVQNIPLTEDEDGSLLLLAPLDMVAWTPEVGNAFEAMTRDIRDGGVGRQYFLEITGSLTPRAKSELKRLGWIVINRSGFK